MLSNNRCILHAELSAQPHQANTNMKHRAEAKRSTSNCIRLEIYIRISNEPCDCDGSSHSGCNNNTTTREAEARIYCVCVYKQATSKLHFDLSHLLLFKQLFNTMKYEIVMSICVRGACALDPMLAYMC